MPTDERHAADSGELDGLIMAVQGIEERLAAFAADQQSRLEEFRQVIDQVQLEQRQAEGEITLYGTAAATRANEALARADEALQRLETLAPALEACEASPAELPGSLPAGRDALASSVRDVAERLAASAAHQESRLEELRQLLDQVQREQRQTEGEACPGGEQATTRANEAWARADEALQRHETLAAASQAREASSTELLGRLSAGWDALTSSVREVEQRLAASATHQESRLEELRQLIDQVQREQRQAVGEACARGAQATTDANEALARADEALQRLETLAAASEAREVSTSELLGRLSAGWETLTSSVREVEQRLAASAARQESRLEELRQLTDQVQREQRHAVGEACARGAQATTRANEALARADEAVQRLETLAAASEAREVSTSELLGRLSAGWDALARWARDVEQRVAAVAAQQKSSEGRSPRGIRAVRGLEQQDGSIPGDPARRAAGVSVASERFQAAASWLALTAPGILLALMLLALTSIAAPWLSSLVYVAPGMRATAAALLLAHCVTTILVVRRGKKWLAAVAFLAVLAVDAFCAGLLLGADLQAESPAISICLAVLSLSVIAGGWPMGLASVLAASAGIGVAMYGGLAPLVVSSVLWSSAARSAGPSLPNAPALANTAPVFSSILSVETLYGGSPVIVLGSSVPLFMPVLAIALLAIGIGAGITLLRTRKTRAAVVAAIVAAHRSAVRG